MSRTERRKGEQGRGVKKNVEESNVRKSVMEKGDGGGGEGRKGCRKMKVRVAVGGCLNSRRRSLSMWPLRSRSFQVAAKKCALNSMNP